MTKIDPAGAREYSRRLCKGLGVHVDDDTPLLESVELRPVAETFRRFVAVAQVCEPFGGHGVVDLGVVLVVLVHVQHDHGVGQGEGCVCVRDVVALVALVPVVRKVFHDQTDQRSFSR